MRKEIGYCHSCGETFLPELDNKKYKKEFHFRSPPSISYHDHNLISLSGRDFKENNFVQFLKNHFTVDQIKDAILMYCIVTPKHWKGVNIFWQIDQRQRVRNGKVMLYNTNTGKRSNTHF